MASSDFLFMRSLAKRGAVQRTGTDTPVAVRIRNKAGKAVTSVTVTTATDVVLIDSDGTTTVTFATDATLAAVVARINSTQNWEAMVLDALGTLASASTLVTGAVTPTVFEGVTYYDLKTDTSAALQIGAALAVSRHTSPGLQTKAHRVVVQELLYAVNMGTAAADSVQLWKRSSAPGSAFGGGIETQVFGALSVDTTQTSITWALGQGTITGDDGDTFILLVKDAATLADAATNFVQISGQIE